MTYSLYCEKCGQSQTLFILVDGPPSEYRVCRACGEPFALPCTEEFRVLRPPRLAYRWTPPPVFESMRRSLFAHTFCNECQRRVPLAFTQCLDYHPRSGDVCEGCGAVYEIRPPYASTLFPTTHWRRRGALEVMREALGLLQPVSRSSSAVVKPPQPMGR